MPRPTTAPSTTSDPADADDADDAADAAARLSAVGRQIDDNPSVDSTAEQSTDGSPVYLIRTSRGWQVSSPVGIDEVDGLVEGMSLADLVAEELGGLAEPDRLARRSARGAVPKGEDAGDPAQARIAALERTVAQLEHALAARVTTERAIGVLAERSGTDPRAAFESLRREARASGRPVAELAREVLDALVPRGDASASVLVAAPPARRSPELGRQPTASLAAEGRS